MQPPDAMAMSRSPAVRPRASRSTTGILPDLGIDEPAEGEREEALLDALPGHGLVAMHRLAQAFIARAAKGALLRDDGILSCGHSSPVLGCCVSSPGGSNGLG